MNLLTAIWISLMAGVAGYIVIEGVFELGRELKGRIKLGGTGR